MRPSIIIGASLGAVLVGGLLGRNVLEAKTTASQPPPAPVPVVTAIARQQDVPIVLTGLGTVQALNTATVRSQVTGILRSVNFTEGQQVHKGDVLARIDPRTFQAQLDQVTAQLHRDGAQLADDQSNLNRDVPLLKSGYATDQQVTNERYQVAQLQSAAQADAAAIAAARTQLSFATLTAPFDGVTGVRLIDQGNVIHPTDANGLVVVTQIKPISVVFTLPAIDIRQIQDALAAGPVRADAYDQAGQHLLDTGRLLLVNNQADPATGTVQLKAIFPNADLHLWPGTFVNVDVATSIDRNAVTIPTDAIQLGPNGDMTYVVGPDHTVAVRNVRVGQRHDKQAVIASGLSAGETVVTQGQYRLSIGTVVAASSPDKVANSTTASAGLLP